MRQKDRSPGKVWGLEVGELGSRLREVQVTQVWERSEDRSGS